MQTYWSLNKKKTFLWMLMLPSLTFIVFSVLVLFLYFTDEDKEKFFDNYYFYLPLSGAVFLTILIIPLSIVLGRSYFKKTRKIFNLPPIKEFLIKYQFEPILLNVHNKFANTEEAFAGNIFGFETVFICSFEKYPFFGLVITVSPKKLENNLYNSLSVELYKYGASYDPGFIRIPLAEGFEDEEILVNKLNSIEPITVLLKEKGISPFEGKTDYTKIRKMDLRKR